MRFGSPNEWSSFRNSWPFLRALRLLFFLAWWLFWGFFFLCPEVLRAQLRLLCEELEESDEEEFVSRLDDHDDEVDEESES
jgi:hypothetical protein